MFKRTSGRESAPFPRKTKMWSLRFIDKRDVFCIRMPFLRDQLPLRWNRMTVDFDASDEIFGRMVGPQSSTRCLQTEQLGRRAAGLQPDDGLRRMERHRLRVSCHLKTSGAKSG